ncbi:DegT/DnrJ/EryC1/StrS family aminotransferase [Adlercreutzia shanghongiae]|uniref:Aminotransferase class I/II-fold pyridoxal phosphate-dependent enzyme n=1 Tax=Adlercreutzia shanghongiae TaxID=3111773 RepID=A0ABU6J0F7_9ACTN|nr:aminotransferase class I/II-fold pyridoxal phosphate-dependent enzyme [Adlercreutzia sp. R22]MEC4295544.1 aminotransferase class I/II-fold pyridoxal phosphate-dependent enzyme [Adlercreutzia sp. R22]
MSKEESEKIWLSSPTMHGEEMEYVLEAYQSNWMSTLGANIDAVEDWLADYVGCKYAVALASGTASLHLAMKLAGVKPGDEVLCSDLTFSATVNPIEYEGGIPVFVDCEYETWNMDPLALEKAFELHPSAKVVVLAHLYGTPAKLDEIVEVVRRHDAVLIEDAAESLGAQYRGTQTGCFGKYGCVSFNGNKIITGSSGGMLLCDDGEKAFKARKWSTQSREDAPWYQHEELGYNYRMSNVVAGVVRGQLPHLRDHIEAKKTIFDRYRAAFADLPISMNPYESDISMPNHWLSCLLIDEAALAPEVRGEREVLYRSACGKSSPHAILDALASINAEGRPIWKPMHSQPLYRNNPFVLRDGNGRARTSAYAAAGAVSPASEDVFRRGVCLPSDIKMSAEQQGKVIDVIRKCFE